MFQRFLRMISFLFHDHFHSRHHFMPSHIPLSQYMCDKKNYSIIKEIFCLHVLVLVAEKRPYVITNYL